MKIQKKSKKKHPIIIAAMVVLLVISGATFCYTYFFHHAPKANPAIVTPNTEPTKTDTANLNNNPAPNQEREAEKKPLLQVEPSTEQPSKSLSASISHQTVANEQLILRTTIDQVVASGSCTLILKNSNRTVTKNAPIIQNPSSSSCAGFNIPLAELGTGKWLISIQITSGNQKNIITSSIIL